ncbi:MAG: DUF1653 domain-containing protein [Lachnospiraceae bacterium]|nr:DUF1653 domain-containing protein [Lachnospiraceae bacterium]
MTEPKPQEIYRHFKGRYYQVITMATKEDTEERLVIYQALYGNYGVYARSLSSFTERLDPARYASQNVTGQTFRFEKADPDALRETPPRTGRAQEKAEDGGTQRENGSFPQESGLDPRVEAFLDASSLQDKLEILTGLRGRVTNEMVDTMAIASGIEIDEGDPGERLEELRSCLLTIEKYEQRRKYGN